MPPADAAIAAPPFNPLRGLAKYFKIFRVSLTERLHYRGDFFLGTVLRYLPMLTTILLWNAVYVGASEGGDVSQTKIADYSFRQMIAYLLLIHVSRAFSSMPGVAAGISRDIRDGNLKKYLIQPLDMIAYLLAYRAAHKVAYIATSALPYALLFFLCWYFGGIFESFPDAVTFLAYLLSLLLGFAIGFFFETAMGMTGFWILEVSSLLWVVNTVNFFVSGQMIPLEVLGEPWTTILKLLPFQYLAYFPARVFLGKVPPHDLWLGLLQAFAWVVVLLILCRWLYARGLRRYSAFGG
jgi:ABC-2 type transport system permease protein